MSRKLKRTIAAIALLLGIGCLLYPAISNLIISHAQEQVAKENIVVAESADSSEIQREKDKAISYNQALANGKACVSDPFDPSRQTIEGMDYQSILNLSDNGVMCSIKIPSAEIFVPVYHGTSDESLENGAGHLVGSSLPIGGEGTHCVIAGHTGLPSVKIFDRLIDVKVGDYICVDVLGENLYYRVTSIETVLPEDTDSLAIQAGKDLMTLVTCTPYGINTHRLFVHAQRCDAPPEDIAKTMEPTDKRSWISIAIAALVPVAIFIVVIIWRKKRR